MNLRPRKSEAPRVDITPLIDVVFLMLIFFMVSTTFDDQTQLKVDLPSNDSEQLEKPDSVLDKISITIDPKGQYYVNDFELINHDAATLANHLLKITDGRKDLPVVVSGDKSAPLQSMITVMSVVGDLGLTKLSFVTKQLEDKAN